MENKKGVQIYGLHAFSNVYATVYLLCRLCVSEAYRSDTYRYIETKKNHDALPFLASHRGFILVDGKELESELNNDISNKSAVAVY